MTRPEAVAEAIRRWGKQAYGVTGKLLSSPERRERAVKQAQPLKAELEALIARGRALQTRIGELDEQARYYKFEVGYRASTIGVVILGRGDTWEEAFATADATAPALAGKGGAS